MTSKAINTLMLFQAISTCGSIFLKLYYPFFLINILGLSIASMAILVTTRIALGACSEFFAGIFADKFGYKKTILTGTLFEIAGLVILIYISVFKFNQHIEYSVVLLSSIFIGLSDIFWPGYHALLGRLDGKCGASVFPKLNIVWKWASLLGAVAFFISANTLGSWVFIADITTSIIFSLYIIFAFKNEVTATAKPSSSHIPHKSYKSAFINILRSFSFLKNIKIAQLALIQGIVLIVDSQLYVSIPVYWEHENIFGPRFLSLIIIIHSILTILFQLAVSRHSREHSDNSILKLGSLLLIIGFYFRSTFDSTLLLIGGSILAAFGDMLLFPRVKSLVARFSEDNHSARSMSYFYTIQNLASVAAPSLGVFILAFRNKVMGWSIFNLISLVFMFGIIFILRAPKASQRMEASGVYCADISQS